MAHAWLNDAVSRAFASKAEGFCFDIRATILADLPTYYYATPFEVLFFLGLDFSLIPYSISQQSRIRFQFSFNTISGLQEIKGQRH